MPSFPRLFALRALLACSAFVLLVCAGRAQGQNQAATPAAVPAAAEVPADYRIARGDELSFRFFYAPELNTTATVRSDGRVALPLIGELRVEGQTMAVLAAEVERLMSAQVRRPQVVINVQGSGSQRVFVGGEVARPGMQPLLGPLSLVQAVMVAEGLKDSAQARQVILMRRGPQGERQVRVVDLEAALSGRDASQDVSLQPYDVVMVPRSGISDLNLWVDQYIRRVLPFSLGFSYTVNRNGVVQ
jgi:polysaccharide biosynthesis/export protein